MLIDHSNLGIERLNFLLSCVDRRSRIPFGPHEKAHVRSKYDSVRHIKRWLYRLFSAVGLAGAESAVIASVGDDTDDFEPTFIVFSKDKILLIEFQISALYV